jgi:predicted glycogen debranching enzyme
MRDETRRLTKPASGWSEAFLSQREWLITNGLGAYASGTIAGTNTRSHHGLLTAALPAPLGRFLMAKQITERLQFTDGTEVTLNDDTPAAPGVSSPVTRYLSEFFLDMGLPVWRFAVEGRCIVERRVFMPQRQNTVYVVYRLVEGSDSVRFRLRPWVHFRPHDKPMDTDRQDSYALHVRDDRYEITLDDDLPAMRLALFGDQVRFVIDGGARKEIFLPVEAERGYTAQRVVWSPGYFVFDLAPGQEAAVVASSEAWSAISALSPKEGLIYERNRRRRLVDLADARVREAPIKELIFTADQFLITPAGRTRDMIRAQAAGDEVRSVIAGYHWFSDWGRDTMISLEGLALITGRYLEAGWILRTFGHYVRDGLIPNMFPDGREEGLYHTADATLWFFHAVDRYVSTTGDRATLKLLLPILHGIIEFHMNGTRFGIGVDPEDGLLRQGEPGYQLTWMDAKVDDWVVTPRRGKAVEINALWYNALRLLARWAAEEQDAGSATRLATAADRVHDSFNRRFWYESGGYLYDVIDGEHGNDSACRPNQLFAISLPHPVLQRDRWEAVLDVARKQLVTPVGLRSLAPGHLSYKSRYFGDLRTRDAAYHQGTVWGWLIGPLIDAWLAAYPDDKAGARRFLEGFVPHLDDACIGSISEIFDAEEPYTPRGCVSQAWSVAEVLRCWAKTE